MHTTTMVNRLLIAALLTTASACASVDPVAYGGIASSSYLTPNTQDDSARVPYRYATETNWRGYTKLILDPVVIYRGADQQFGDLSEEDKAALANHMQAQFADRLRTRFALVKDPAPNTLRVKLTLTGAVTNTPVLGTLSRFDLMGGLYNGVQSVRGGEGTLTGSVIYAVEIADASSNRLLSASVTKQYPNSMNIMASMGSLAASKVGIEKGADALLAQLR